MTLPTDDQGQRSRMVQLLSRLAVAQGVCPSLVPGVRLMRADHSIPRSPALYQPSVVIIAQGRKRGFVGGNNYVYDPDHFLVLAIPLPFECRTQATSDGKPMLGLSIGMDIGVVAELLAKLPAQPAVDETAAAQAILSAPLDTRLRGAAIRLMECLSDAEEANVLGPQLVRELTYHALRGPHGAGLRALAAKHGHLARIRRVLDQIHEQFASPFDVAGLAKAAAMSPSVFHAHFRTVTSTTPLQYVKAVRLHKARMLMVSEHLPAAQAAMHVGYESPSQFSREFKRFFGRPPHRETVHMRRLLGLGAAGEFESL